MKPGDDEAGPAGAAPPRRAGHAEHDDRREQDERDDAEAARGEPERVRVQLCSSGQPATSVLSPPTLTSRAGRRRAASQAGASSSMNDAVLATFASTQVLPATLTVRQGDSCRSAGARIDEMVQLGRAAPPAPHRRGGRREAAGSERNRRPGRVERRCMVVADPHRPAALGSLAGDGDVAAERDERRACDGGSCACRAVARERFRRGPEIELDA